jgi:exoribonuclease R
MNENLVYLQKLKACLIELKLLYEKTKGQKIQRDVLSLVKSAQNLLQCLIDDERKIAYARWCIDYYWPELTGIVKEYVAIKGNHIESEDALKTARQIEDFLPKAGEAMNRILEKISIKNHAESEIDMKILLDELKSRG